MATVTIQQAFDLALQHHQAGRLQDAERLYRQILAQLPGHAAALNRLGLIAHQVGRNDIAIDLIGRALVLNPKLPEAHFNLSAALKESGQLDGAIAAARQAVVLNPDDANAHSNLGAVLADKGQLEEAIRAYRHAIALNSSCAPAYVNLGDALRSMGQLDQAIAACRQAILLAPNFPQAHRNLGNALRDIGQLNEAIMAYRQAISLNPNYAQAYTDLGTALAESGQLDQAIAAYGQAIAIMPGDAAAYCNLGQALRDKGKLDEAIASCQKAIALKPDFPAAHNNLGNALADKGRPDEAITAYRRAITLDPNVGSAHNNLGTAIQDQGQLDEALVAYRQAVALRPNYVEAHSNLIFAMHFHPAYDGRAIGEELRRWNHQHAQPLRKFIRSHSNDRSPDRRLRIGYVSPDFRDHVVGRNLMPLFQEHDRRQFEITCYAQVTRPDAMTSRFQQFADSWRNIVGLSDEHTVQQIREDRIDIVVDLALHTANNRLLIFAYKPAPVQVTFAGYPGSTGLNTIDYRLSDPYLDPPGMDESVYSEQTIRLPDSFWCYDPLDGSGIPVNRLPALESGLVTFGCLNNFCKVNDSVLAFWAQALRQVENSRLMLLAHPGGHRQRTVDRLSKEGIDPQRIEFNSPRSRRAYLELYQRVDIGLDSFPYNGHTTSLESIWMGVPVVTLVGQTAVSRAGWCQLSNLGLTELAGQNAEEFARIGVELARDLPRLAELRSTLRRRMEQSPLMDASGFAKNVEAAYRQMWHTWCEGG